MKSYRIYETKKARGDQGACATCGTEIKSGDPYKYAEPSLGKKVFFCNSCAPDQSLISKNNGTCTVAPPPAPAPEPVQAEAPKVWCTKCQKNHTVGSGRHTKHIKFCN